LALAALAFVPLSRCQTLAPPSAAATAGQQRITSGSPRGGLPVVTLDVGVLLEETGEFYPSFKAPDFRVYEDGQLQKIIGFQHNLAPVTVLLLCEVTPEDYAFINHMRAATYAFAQQLPPADYLALMTFNQQARMVSGVTQNKRQFDEAISSLTAPSLSDQNLFGAISEAEDRLSRIQGRKYIVLIASGRDSSSTIPFDKVLQTVKDAPDVTIFSVTTGDELSAVAEASGKKESKHDKSDPQADKQMMTFADVTGGLWFNPSFAGEMPDIFRQIDQDIRNRYQLIYRPTDARQDGTYRKLRVELTDSEGHPLRLEDPEHGPLHYEILVREGYRAGQEAK
jgi:VWFA-related protein